MKNLQTEAANPNPEFLIKSIAEQGYSLETALADLIDNSISANADKIEILSKIDGEPFTLFISDNGDGMNAESMRKNMQLPSKSVEEERIVGDLGRFGLGLKTASFSQTRCFTVISRKKGETEYTALSWDVNYLKRAGEWRIIVNSEDEIKELLESYYNLSDSHLNSFEDFTVNTLIVWRGLYKYEDYDSIPDGQDALKTDITQNTEKYLSLVFHRFMERSLNPLQIRINNVRVKPFNPFPVERSDFRGLDPSYGETKNGHIKIQGFVLPNCSIKESKEGLNIWTPEEKSLIDLEGIYIYRADRLILFGGWHGIIKKEAKLQLARLKVDIDNNSDLLFHLNVAKSQINIPYKWRNAFYRSIVNLKEEAKKEFYNYGIKVYVNDNSHDKLLLYNKVATNKGIFLLINDDFPLLKNLRESLTKEQLADLNIILRMSGFLINKIKLSDNVEIVSEETLKNSSIEEIKMSLQKLINIGYTKEQIKKDILPGIGYHDNIPEEILNLLK